MEIRDANAEKIGGHWFWDIKKIELIEKPDGGSVCER
jgi:hypothetical protein